MPRNNTAGLRVCITSDVYIYIYISRHILYLRVYTIVEITLSGVETVRLDLLMIN